MSVSSEELGFFNQQLAAMLKGGIPLEGALREITGQMGQMELRDELRLLERDLAAGLPLSKALPARCLPPFYVQTVLAGANGGDLPGVLLLLADYYSQTQGIWLRLKGLMVYPALVLAISLLLSTWVSFLQHPLATRAGLQFTSGSGLKEARALPAPERRDLLVHSVYFWMPPLALLAIALISATAAGTPLIRRTLRWRLPAFKEASLAQFAAAMQLLLRSGSTLSDALGFLIPVESGTPAAAELRAWKERLGRGNATLADITAGSEVFPPLFLWLLSSAGDDPALGFERAAALYRERALYRSELLLNGFLPASMLLLGIMVALQVYPLASQGYRTLQGMSDLLGVLR